MHHIYQMIKRKTNTGEPQLLCRLFRALFVSFYLFFKFFPLIVVIIYENETHTHTHTENNTNNNNPTVDIIAHGINFYVHSPHSATTQQYYHRRHDLNQSFSVGTLYFISNTIFFCFSDYY